MKKSKLSGLLLATIAMGGVAQASPATHTAPKAALPVVAGATALSKSEKAGVNGKFVSIGVTNYVNAYDFSLVGVTTSVNFGHHNRYR